MVSFAASCTNVVSGAHGRPLESAMPTGAIFWFTTAVPNVEPEPLVFKTVNCAFGRLIVGGHPRRLDRIPPGAVTVRLHVAAPVEREPLGRAALRCWSPANAEAAPLL